jgi:hypothetical protein
MTMLRDKSKGRSKVADQAFRVKSLDTSPHRPRFSITGPYENLREVARCHRHHKI